jgi:RimJ/RimL family protein N-acetyltransferase
VPAVGASAFGFNGTSRGLLESLGFVEEGRRRKFMFVDGEYRDMVHYGLLRAEWDDRA